MLNQICDRGKQTDRVTERQRGSERDRDRETDIEIETMLLRAVKYNVSLFLCLS